LVLSYLENLGENGREEQRNQIEIPYLVWLVALSCSLLVAQLGNLYVVESSYVARGYDGRGCGRIYR
jgi:hypothetical protein